MQIICRPCAKPAKINHHCITANCGGNLQISIQYSSDSYFLNHICEMVLKQKLISIVSVCYYVHSCIYFIKMKVSYNYIMSLIVYGITLWNSLCPDLKKSKSINVFKRKYKEVLICAYG